MLLSSSYEFNTVKSNIDLDKFFKNLEILELLGEGAAGKVFKAWDKKLGKFFALKFVKV